MPVDDLSGVSGLDDKQRDVLEDKLGITTCYELIMADRRTVVASFGRRGTRPTLEEVAEWQDAARRKRATTISAGEWETVMSFVVAYEQRVRNGTIELRVVAEQAEVEPDSEPQAWSGWESDPVGRWMAARVGGSAPELGPAPDDEPKPAGTAKTPDEPTERPAIQIERATIRDAGGTTMDVVVGSAPVASPPAVLVQPVRLEVVGRGLAAWSAASVALRLARPGGPQSTLNDHLDERGTAELRLMAIEPGPYEPTLAIWVPDGSSQPCAVKLPTIHLAGEGAGTTGPP